MTTVDSPSIQVSASYTGSGNTHLNALTLNTTQQLEFIFTGGATLSSAPFIPSDYSGDVAEIIIFESALSNDQMTEVYNYIDGAYP